MTLGSHILQYAILVVLCAAVLVRGTPFWATFDEASALYPRDMVSQCTGLVLGATRTPVGTVCVGTTGTSLTITYTIDPTKTYTLTKVHAWVGTGLPTITAPGQMPYTNENGICKISADGKSAVCTIPTTGPYAFPPRCSGAFNVVTHASLASLGADAGTAWDDGTCYDNKGNCAKYFTVYPKCQCPVVTAYDPVTHTNTYSTIKTIVVTESTIVLCSSTPAAQTTSTSCDIPTAAPTVTITSSKALEFTCDNPYTTSTV